MLANLLRILEETDAHGVVVPVSSSSQRDSFLSSPPSPCMHMNFDVRRWTLYLQPTTLGAAYHASESHTSSAGKSWTCQLLENTAVAFLFPMEHLETIDWTIGRPWALSIFIQAQLRNLTLIRGDMITFGHGDDRVEHDMNNVWELRSELFSDQHYRKKLEREEAKRKKALFKTFGIKVVRRQDRVFEGDSKPEGNNDINEEWYGCSHATSRCFGTVVDDTPEYIYAGRWTPPCCLGEV